MNCHINLIYKRRKREGHKDLKINLKKNGINDEEMGVFSVTDAGVVTR